VTTDPSVRTQRGPVRVLVVDDFEPWRRWVRSVVGMQEQLQIVGESSDGLEAVLKAQELRPELILLDINLPSLDGLEASKRILVAAPETKIIYVTTQTDPDLVSVAMSNGVLGYVSKNEAANDLLRAIDSVLRAERFVSGVPQPS